MAFALSSQSFVHGAAIPARYTCDGENVSPTLQWSDPPEATRSFALIMDDPDAPSGTFTHWVLYDIAGDRRELTEGQATGEAGHAGLNSFARAGYGGPCPPRGHGPHRYSFRLMALNVPTLRLPAGATRQEVERAFRAHVLATAEVTGTYERKR